MTVATIVTCSPYKLDTALKKPEYPIQPTSFSKNFRIEFMPSKGRGVFTDVDIPKGSMVEISPVIRLSQKDYEVAEKTFLYEYMYGWSDDGGAIALGYGSLFNHQTEANLHYQVWEDQLSVAFYAKRDIKGGEELTINYQQRFADEHELWFQNSE
ncbi:Histone methyltransferase, PBCV type putative domain-containing protein [Rozella allomycis CSF55]|uniref:Histone methyltransferase, PBCV type putative domain-containing protein n=1 Tax=Rozella allomycis (strain CSF55) TaxID=988480 RepID=A0A075ANX1_ROZAC|nr:Histone methyltransferase, PBCV type putative domain-containing protein [Rozella allomycis CSF55]|eukprot:EPZ31675.1 Histone methyltransferase, PBCV type putative domain-containing protein [Rozella allomycis CSF55]